MKGLAGGISTEAAASPVVLAAMVVVSIVNVPYMFPAAITAVGLLAFAVVLLADVVVIAGLLLLRGRVRSARAATGWIIAVCSLRSATLFVLWRGLGVTDVTPARPALSGIFFTSVLLVLTVTVDAMLQAVRRQNEIHALHERIRELALSTDAAMQQERADVVDDVRCAVGEVLASLPTQSPARAAARLRVVAHDVVRPLSHSLIAAPPPIPASSARVTEYRLDVPAIRRRAASDARVPAGEVTLALAVLSVLYNLTMARSGLQVVPALIAATCLYLAATLYNRVLAPRVTHHQAWSATAAMTVIGCALGLLLAPVAVNPGRFVGATTVLLPVVGWAVLLIEAVGEEHRRSAEQLEDLSKRLEWELARSNARMRAQRRELARILHGPLQAALNAAVIRIDRLAPEALDGHLVGEVTVAVEAALCDLGQADAPRVDLAVALDRVRGTWEGLCDVRISDLDSVIPAVRHDAVAAATLGEIVTEACSNAVRHGDARSVVIELSQPRPGVIRVHIADDGVGLPANEPAGLGTAHLQTSALAWSRTSAVVGTQVQVDIPMVPKK